MPANIKLFFCGTVIQAIMVQLQWNLYMFVVTLRPTFYGCNIRGERGLLYISSMYIGTHQVVSRARLAGSQDWEVVATQRDLIIEVPLRVV